MHVSAESLEREIEQRCAQASGAVTALCETQAAVERVVRHDAWCALTVDPATLLPTGGFHEYGVDSALAPRLIEIETTNTDLLSLPALSRSASRASTLATAADGELERSTRYREVLKPSGLEHEMRLLFPAEDHVWACLILFREPGAPDFAEDELDLLVGATAGVGAAVRRQLVLTEISRTENTLGPGLVLLDERLDCELATPPARHWLADVDDGLDVRHGLPYAVTSVAGRALTTGGSSTSRLRTSKGRWLTLHADPIPGEPTRVSVIVEPSRAVEVAQIVADAYQLTRREREVVHFLTTGYSRSETARALGVSAHTVDDHIKRVYAKMDVRSRAELTSRLFFDQHAPRLADGVPVGGTGWFLR